MVTIPEAFPQAFACFDRLSTSLGVSSSVRASGLIACSRIWESTRRVSPFRMSILRDLRTVLYAVSLVSGRYQVALEYVAKWEHFPFEPACQGRSAERPYLAGSVGAQRRCAPTTLQAYLRPLPIATCWGHHRLRLAAYPLFTLALRRVFTTHTT